jgi:hypothetical protein
LSSAFSTGPLVGVSGSSAIPQIGQLPGRSRRISGCIGQMGGHLTGLVDRLGLQTSNWVQLLLASPVVLWAEVGRHRPVMAAQAFGEEPRRHGRGDAVEVGRAGPHGARERTSGAIRALLDLAPQKALRLGTGGADEEASWPRRPSGKSPGATVAATL